MDPVLNRRHQQHPQLLQRATRVGIGGWLPQRDGTLSVIPCRLRSCQQHCARPTQPGCSATFRRNHDVRRLVSRPISVQVVCTAHGMLLHPTWESLPYCTVFWDCRVCWLCGLLNVVEVHLTATHTHATRQAHMSRIIQANVVLGCSAPNPTTNHDQAHCAGGLSTLHSKCHV
jgi:hypothetical protein